MTGRIVKIADPSVSLESIQTRINDEQTWLVDCEARGRKFSAQKARRRISALKGAATRIGRML